jgi:hypothetical protein
MATRGDVKQSGALMGRTGESRVGNVVARSRNVVGQDRVAGLLYQAVPCLLQGQAGKLGVGVQGQAGILIPRFER